MSEEIIINGANVAECRHLSFVEEDYCCDCQYEKYALCSNSDCYYKQLKRLQTDNKGLKSTNDFVAKQLERRVNQLREYRKALEEIREYLQQFKKKKSNFYTLNDVVTDIASNIEKIISEVLK